jgi:hypothetical protein
MLKTLFLFLIVLLAAAAQAIAGEPRLTLLFCANTEAEARACPS